MNHFFIVLILSFVSQCALAVDIVDISNESNIKITYQQATICTTEQNTDLNNLDPCAFKDMHSNNEFARGLSKNTTWIRFQVHNSQSTEATRWMSMATPRIESIAVYIDSFVPIRLGTKLPMATREIEATIPVVPITLTAGETKTITIAYQSQTFVDASVNLWKPTNFYSYQSGIQFFQAIGMGGLLLGAIFSLMIYFIIKERSFIYFSIALLGSFSHEFQQTGFIFLLGWPENISFYTPMIAFSTGISTIFYTLFIHTFIDDLFNKYRKTSLLIIGIAAINILAILYSIFIDFQGGAIVWSIGIFILLLSGIIALAWAWKQGEKSAGLIIMSFILVLVFEGIKLLFVMGGLQFSMTHNMLGPWAVLLTTPLILIAISIKNKKLREDLLQSQLQTENKAKFVQTVNHEIRSPLNRIIHLTNNISRLDIKTPIIDQAQYILSIIDDALKYQSIDNKRVYANFTDVKWHKFMEQLTFNSEETVNNLFQKNNNKIIINNNTESDFIIYIDSYKTLQAIDNLINNAAKYCHDSEIKLTITMQMHSPQQNKGNLVEIIFLVCDNGTQIPYEDKERIFMPFIRGKNAENIESNSQGMGLAIVKQLLDQMNIFSTDSAYQNRIWLDTHNDYKCFGISLYTFMTTDDNTVHKQTTHPLTRMHQKELMTLLQMGDINGIIAWANQLKLNEPHLKEIAEHIITLASTLKINELKQLLV